MLQKSSTKNFTLILLFTFIFKISFINSSKSCEPGYYLTKNGCAPCPAGHYSKDNDMDHCELCEPGTYSKTGESSCSLCPAGTYSLTTSSVCIPCPAGAYSSKEGSDSCTRCPRGTYSISGSVQCMECPKVLFPGGKRVLAFLVLQENILLNQVLLPVYLVL